MVYKRKYEISPADGKEYFLKWKARLAAVGCAQEPGDDDPFCEYCVEYVLAYERVYSHSDVDSYDVQSQMVRRQL